MITAFPYPGGKTPYVERIIQHFPAHRRYVEPFGGAAAVLLNKPESYVEVYNDLDDDIVQFFRVARERREDLQEWLRHVPYSESLYEEWIASELSGERPDDPVQRAGRWFALRYMNYGGTTQRRAGFKRPGKRNEARSFRGAADSIEEVVGRFQEVTIACEDYRDVLDRYDSPDTLFYLDPPYVGIGEAYYPAAGGRFDREEFVDALENREGYWIVSYGEPLDRLRDTATTLREFTAHYSLPNTTDHDRQEATERLAMNFDPEEVEEFTDAAQTTLDSPRGWSA